MSTFSVDVVRIDEIQEHPNADVLEVAIIGGYRSIVRKGMFKAGEAVVYIPEASIVPQWLLLKMNLFDLEKNKGGVLPEAMVIA